LELFSIGIPAIKANYFESALKSLINQTFKDFEIILCDYSKNDEIKKVVEKYNDSRIKYYKFESNGIIKDWNRCLEFSNREYFVLFSDDDIYSPIFLETVKKFIEKYPNNNIFKVRTKIINENDKLKQITTNAAEYESAVDFIWHRFKSYRMQFAGDFIVKTETLKKIGGFIPFPDAWYTDDATWFKIANINGIINIPMTLFYYRDSNITVSQSGKIEKKIHGLNEFEIWFNDFLQTELVINKDEKDILEDLLKIKNQRFITITGNILSSGLYSNKIIDIFKILVRYLKSKKLSKHINKKSLLWAILLRLKK